MKTTLLTDRVKDAVPPELMTSKSVVSVDIDPSKGGMDSNLNQGRGNKPYTVQEDELVIATSTDKLTSLVGTCAGFYGKAKMKDKDVLVFAHIDVEVSERKLRAKLNRMRKALTERGVKMSSTLLDISPYTGETETNILRNKIEPKGEITLPKDTEERVVTVAWDSIEMELHTRTGDTKRTIGWNQ